MPKTLVEYLKVEYPLNLIPDSDGGYVFEYPDLPGCLGQIDSLAELPEHAGEARALWLETALERGKSIPPPSREEIFSGKFIVRVPKALHRRLVNQAKEEGVSLNYYAGTLLTAGLVQSELSIRIEELCTKVDALHDHLGVSFVGVHPNRNLDLVVDAFPLAA